MSHHQPDLHRTLTNRPVRQPPLVAAVHPARHGAALGAHRLVRDRTSSDPDLTRAFLDCLDHHTVKMGQQNLYPTRIRHGRP